MALDPTMAEGREVFYDLVRWADVVTESFSPRAMKSWGLGYDALREIITGVSDGLGRFWVTVWSVDPAREQRSIAPTRQPQLPAPQRDHPYIPPPGAAPDDIVPTPIAARPTRASSRTLHR